ncbi:MAG TPA: hydroxymethylbilane synthase [Chitinophagales bacterium]|nr:hydroxymethylbilane synthase [Chitinophagales bacterium]
MKQFKIVCRSSALSVIQANLAKGYLQQAAPDAEIDIVLKETSGDTDRSRPLYEMEGRDFFSKEIDEILLSGGADFAVHSMKDLSGERIEDKRFVNAVPERNDPRDVVIFNSSVIQKLAAGQPLVIGTSSLRRQQQALGFLQKVLPVLNGNSATTQAQVIRGNVDSRLHQLEDGSYDGIILAAAGLNRLLAAGNQRVATLLTDKLKMFLPLIECAPAPGQGALLVEALRTNNAATELLQKINDNTLTNQLEKERSAVAGFGGGCHQKYGAVFIDTRYGGFVNIAGADANGNDISNMVFDIPVDVIGKKLFSAGDYMKDFFSYKYKADVEPVTTPVVFVAHHRAVTPQVAQQLQGKRVWCSGSRSWRELAKLGIWCEGCADGMGLGFLQPVFDKQLAAIDKNDITILTHTDAAAEWHIDGYKSIGTYQLVPQPSATVQTHIAEADILYWTNFEQYKACGSFVKPQALHMCPAGRTADNFIKAGLHPIVFPGIKAFNVWRSKITR